MADSFFTELPQIEDKTKTVPIAVLDAINSNMELLSLTLQSKLNSTNIQAGGIEDDSVASADSWNQAGIDATQALIDANAQITTERLEALSVTAEKLAEAAVITSKIADAAVDSEKLAELAVETANLANEAVTAPKVANNAITNNKIDVAAVSESKTNWNTHLMY